MAARLIINADDFGLTPGINRAIAELHQAGVLSSATLMASGLAFDNAVAIAKAHPGLGVGCHVVLLDGTPVLPPSEIPSLLGPNGRSFRTTLGHFVRDLFLGRIREEEITREAFAQIHKLQQAGIDVTHADTHKHTHIFPAVARPLIEALHQSSVGSLRKPFEPGFAQHLRHAGLKRRLQMAVLSRFEAKFEILTAQTLSTEGTVGISATGTLARETLREILTALPAEGLFELCCHPGYNDGDLDQVRTRLRSHREVEREALLSEVPAFLLRSEPLKLVHYGELS